MSSDSFEISEYGFASYDRFMQNWKKKSDGKNLRKAVYAINTIDHERIN
jgi:hypothetical protein